jgi:hypothetical protein
MKASINELISSVYKNTPKAIIKKQTDNLYYKLSHPNGIFDLYINPNDFNCYYLDSVVHRGSTYTTYRFITQIANVEDFSTWWATTSIFDKSFGKYFENAPLDKVEKSRYRMSMRIIKTIIDKADSLPIKILDSRYDSYNKELGEIFPQFMVKYEYKGNTFKLLTSLANPTETNQFSFNGIIIPFPCMLGCVDSDSLVDEVLFTQ